MTNSTTLKGHIILVILREPPLLNRIKVKFQWALYSLIVLIKTHALLHPIGNAPIKVIPPDGGIWGADHEDSDYEQNMSESPPQEPIIDKNNTCWSVSKNI